MKPLFYKHGQRLRIFDKKYQKYDKRFDQIDIQVFKQLVSKEIIYFEDLYNALRGLTDEQLSILNSFLDFNIKAKATSPKYREILSLFRRAVIEKEEHRLQDKKVVELTIKLNLDQFMDDFFNQHLPYLQKQNSISKEDFLAIISNFKIEELGNLKLLLNAYLNLHSISEYNKDILNLFKYAVLEKQQELEEEQKFEKDPLEYNLHKVMVELNNEETINNIIPLISALGFSQKYQAQDTESQIINPELQNDKISKENKLLLLYLYLSPGLEKEIYLGIEVILKNLNVSMESLYNQILSEFEIPLKEQTISLRNIIKKIEEGKLEKGIGFIDQLKNLSKNNHFSNLYKKIENQVYVYSKAELAKKLQHRSINSALENMNQLANEDLSQKTDILSFINKTRQAVIHYYCSPFKNKEEKLATRYQEIRETLPKDPPQLLGMIIRNLDNALRHIKTFHFKDAIYSLFSGKTVADSRYKIDKAMSGIIPKK